MSPDSGDDASPTVKVYQAMFSALLAGEFDRRKTLGGRGATLMTASATLVTLIFGLTVIVTGKDHVFANHAAVIFLCGSIGPFALSALFALVVQVYGFPYQVIDRDDLDRLRTDEDFWARSVDHAVRDDVSQQIKTICSLRRGNDKMAVLVRISLLFEFIAILALSAAVGFELYARL
jgi:hypothetical protein